MEDDDDDVLDQELADEHEIEGEQFPSDHDSMDEDAEAALFGSGSQPPGMKAAGKRRARNEEEETEIGEDDEVEDDASDLASQTDDGGQRMHAGLESMPGFRPMIMGSGVKSLPAAFEAGLDDQWLLWNDSGNPFRVGSEPIPARVLAMVATKDCFANDAHNLSEFETHTEAVDRARTVATAALLGMLSTGTAKGWIASPNQSELHSPKCKDMEPDELEKFKKNLQGNVTAYGYHPNAKSVDVTQHDDVAAQFGWCIEELYDSSGKEILAYRIFKVIYDHGHSDDLLWKLLMDESSEITRAGSINSMPEANRKDGLMKQNKLQRTQINDDDMQITASTQYKRVTNIGSLIKMFKLYAGGKERRPLYADIRSDTPIGCQARPFTADKQSGGKHPLGPSVAFNFKRYLAPGVISSEHPGVNVAIAGCVDSAGKPLDIHPAQSNPNNYFTAEGRLRPPEWVRKQGCFYVCHDINARDVFKLKFPRPVNGGVFYEETLCRAFWDLKKTTDEHLVRAIERGSQYNPPRTSFEHHKNLVHRRLDAAVMAREEEVEKISNGILDTEMLTVDSIDKSAVEQQRLDNHRCYGSKAVTKEGDRYILEPQQALRDISEQQQRLHGIVEQWFIKQKADLNRAATEASERRELFDRVGKKEMNDEEHSKNVDSCVRVGLRRFEQAYASKKKAGSIPPGWKDVAHVGLAEALKTAAEHGVRNSEHRVGRRVDPKDVNAKNGTANVAFAHGRSAQGRDFTPFGQWRMFLMHLFSSGVKISGPDVRIMLECWLHAFEPFQEVSFFMLMCGGPGAGKSMRAKRLQALLATGWVKGSGSSSAKAGMNGGMDHLCGRLVYYDEITNDFGSNDSERIDYLKSITMEQHVNNTRTVKTMGKNGLETFTTVVLDSLHFESHLMSTNCGPLGLKADVEPSTNRAALSDRSWAHITHAADDDGDTADVDFDALKASPETKAMINQIRVCSCLIAFVLIYIKEIPHCRPDTSFATKLSKKWDTILWNEYNLPRPSMRKGIKRRMMFELFAVEAAVVEKFFLEETAVAYEDMRPKPDGTLSGYCVDQLVDVIRALQRCLDHETILNAWSHSLDHSPATSSHVFQMKTVLAQMHGSGLDHSTFSLDRFKTPAAGAAGANGAASLDDLDDAEMNRVMDDAAAPRPQQPRMNTFGINDGEPIVAPTDEHGNPVCPTLQTIPMMNGGMTRYDCRNLSSALETQRQMRSEYSRRLEKTGIRKPRGKLTVLEQTTAVLTDGVDRHNVPVHKIAMTGRVVDARKAAAALIPTAQDVLRGGFDSGFLIDVLQCRPSSAFGPEMQMLGVRPSGWDFESISSKSVRGPADYDFNWAILTAFSKSKSGDDGDANAIKVRNKGSLWTNVARQIKASVRANIKGCAKIFSLIDINSMSTESMRDTLFLIAQPLSENKVRVAKYNFAQAQLVKKDSRMHCDGSEFDESFSPGDAGTHPQHMQQPNRDANGKPVFYPQYLKPAELPRLDDKNPSDFQKRLDHLTNHRAFASCVAPVTFEKDLPIKECESSNGIYFSKWIANEHAALVVESATFLARVPGIAGGMYRKVPATFQDTNAATYDAKTPASASPQDDDRSMEVDDEEADEDPDVAPKQDSMAADPHMEEQQREYEAEQELADEQEQAAQPPMASEEIDDEDGDGVASLGSDISHPDREGSGLHAAPGVSAEAARMSVEDDAKVESLPYDWDMLAIFLTLKMAATLHNDNVEERVAKVAEFFPDVFDGEDKEDTLRDIPQICTRFPGLKHKVGSSSVLFPLSVSVPLTESLVCDLRATADGTKAPRELTEAALSMAMGRNIRYDDPEAIEHEAEARGIGSSAMLYGNIFSRSAWLNFTTSTMSKRGMLSEDEHDRALDQGLNLMMRVRNARAVQGHPRRFTCLHSNAFTPLRSFTAQERTHRERGAEGAAAPRKTSEQSKRAQESQQEHQDHLDQMARKQDKLPKNV